MPSHTDRLAMLARIRWARDQTYGDDIPQLARDLGIAPQSWMNFELGVGMPGIVVLGFVSLTGASPKWLISGEGPAFLSPDDRG